MSKGNPFAIYGGDNVNDLCLDCRWSCKQSKAVSIIICPQFEKKERWYRIEQRPETDFKIDLDLLLIDK